MWMLAAGSAVLVTVVLGCGYALGRRHQRWLELKRRLRERLLQ